MIATKNQMLEMEKATGLSERALIEKVGRKTAGAIAKRCTPSQHLVMLCGTGNNGQDGLAIATHLFQWDYAITVVLVDPEHTDLSFFPLPNSVYLSLELWTDQLDQYDVLIDCVYGFGFQLPLCDQLISLFNAINESNLLVYSVDLNSGLEADTGCCAPCALHSQITFALGALKPAHLLNKEHGLFDEVVLIDLDLTEEPSCYQQMDKQRMLKILPKKAVNSYKSQNGQCLNIAGSKGMAGACLLSTKAAMISGVGYMHVLLEEEIYPVVATQALSAVYHFPKETALSVLLQKADAVLAGCGCNGMPQFFSLMEQLMDDCSLPLVLDAWALRWLADHMELCSTYKGPLILTPHLGEFAALSKKTIREINDQKLTLTRLFCEEHDCILVLKGPNTLIMHPDGRCYINQTGNPKLAKAGSGDVLAGLIVGLMAQHTDPFEACMLAVWLHGLAADESKKSEWTFLPEDILDEVQRILS